MAEGYADKITNDRAPRIHMTYAVETEGAVERKELPFVIGVLSQLSGNAPRAPKRLKDKTFDEINKTNFNDMMASMKVGLAFDVDDKITNSGKTIAIKLDLDGMGDFGPTSIVNQVPILKELKDTRDAMQEILSKANQYDKFEDQLAKKLSKPAK